MASFAWVWNRLALTMAFLAGTGNRKKALLKGDLTCALALSTGFRFGSRFCSTSAASFTTDGSWNLDDFFCTESRFFEADLHTGSDIGSGAPCSTPSSGATSAASALSKDVSENIAEDIVDRSAACEPIESAVESSLAAATSSGLTESRMSELIEHLLFLRV
jgi:hypothetical protein